MDEITYPAKILGEKCGQHWLYKDYIIDGRVKVIRIPDICSVNFGRGVGYDIVEHIPPSNIAEISSTKIREQLKINENGGSENSKD